MNNDPAASYSGSQTDTQPISLLRLTVAISLVSIAAFAYWASEGEAARVIGLPVIAANLLMMDRRHLNRPVSRSLLLAMLSVLAVLVSAIVLFPGDRTLEGKAHQTEVLRRSSHPAFVISIWLLICYGFVHSYQRSRQSITEGSGER